MKFIAILIFSVSAQASEYRYPECYYQALNAFKAYADEQTNQQNGSMFVENQGVREVVTDTEHPTYLVQVKEQDDDGYIDHFQLQVDTERGLYGRYPYCAILGTKRLPN